MSLPLPPVHEDATMPDNLTPVLQDLDRRHHLHPFTDARHLNAAGVRIISRAEGVHLVTSTGHRVLDGMAGLWCVNIGYGRRELADAAHAQLLELPYYNTFFQTSTQPATELAARLASVTPAGLDHVFFANSGSEANDTAAKMVRWYWHTRGRPSRKIIISRRHAYHGVTMAAASMCGLEDMHPQFDLPLPGFVHADCPYWYRYGGSSDPEDFGIEAARSVERLILELGPDNVGAFIGEPIMGAGGVIVPPASYWPEVRRICREHDVLIIADEVICGFGRTGPWFGSESFSIDPDIMTVAKGLSSGYQPISAIIVHDRIAGTMIRDGGEFHHGFTWSGHPVAAAVALENIDILERESIIERSGSVTGPLLQRRLRELEDHPLVGEVRGRGMVAAVELVADKPSRTPFEASRQAAVTVREEAWTRGLLIRATGDSLILSPPLVLAPEEIDTLVGILRDALDAAEPRLLG